MKRSIIVTLLVLVSVSFICGKVYASEDMEADITVLQNGIGAVFKDIDSRLSKSASDIAKKGFDTQDGRRIIKELCNGNYVIDCSAIDKGGVMKIVEPSEFVKFEGTKLKDQPEFKAVRRTEKPVLSGVFQSVEKKKAVVFEYPVLFMTGDFIGSLSMLVKPYVLLAGVIEPLVQEKGIHALVMQKDGLILYETDAAEVGKNALKDKPYIKYPDLLALAKKIVDEPEGRGNYMFPVSGSDTPVKKEAVWKTVKLYGTEWKVVVYREESKTPAVPKVETMPNVPKADETPSVPQPEMTPTSPTTENIQQVPETETIPAPPKAEDTNKAPTP